MFAAEEYYPCAKNITIGIDLSSMMNMNLYQVKIFWRKIFFVSFSYRLAKKKIIPDGIEPYTVLNLTTQCSILGTNNFLD